MDVKNLKLIARTEEDLRVVSAHLQDSMQVFLILLV